MALSAEDSITVDSSGGGCTTVWFKCGLAHFPDSHHWSRERQSGQQIGVDLLRLTLSGCPTVPLSHCPAVLCVDHPAAFIIVSFVVLGYL